MVVLDTSAVSPQTLDRREQKQRDLLIETISADYREMSGLSLTRAQALKLFGIESQKFERILHELVARGIVKINAEGLLVRS